MKRDYSHNSLFHSEIITSFISSKNSKLNTYKGSRPLSSNNRLLKTRTYSNSTLDITLPIFTPKNSNVKSFLEPEKLMQEKFQLRNIVRTLKKELFNLKQENFQKKIELKEKNDFIYNLIDKQKSQNDFHENLLMNTIKKHIKQVKYEINDINEKNDHLKKDIKLTKINEYFIEGEKIEEQIQKINSLIENGKEIKFHVNEKINDLNNLKLNIENQLIIINKMNNNYEYLINEEKNIIKNIEEINEKIKQDKKIISHNQNIVLSLKKTNQNLQNDSTINYSNNTTYIPFNIEQNYKNKITETKKLINHYKLKLKFSDNSILDLKNENIKLKDLSINITNKIPNIENKLLLKQKKIKSKKDKKISNEEIINKLKETLKNSKEIETELEKQIKVYKEKLNEIGKSNEQIEFGIDSENPYFSPDENNDPVKTFKFTSIQFNQFTYILFKNFEAKNIVLNSNNQSNFINDIINENSDLKNDNYINNNNSVDISSKKFINIVNIFTNKITEILKCENEYNIQLLNIFIGALLYNSEGNFNKLCEFFSILFSYIKEYSKEEEEKFIKRMNNKYKDKIDLLLKLINEKNTLNNKYISLLEIKDIIDNNEIDLKDKYIEFIFYIMKKFNDKNAKLSDLKITNLSNIINDGTYDDKNNKKTDTDNSIENRKNNEDDNDKNNNKEKENIENNSITNSDNNDESVTEITNEEYEKILKECIISIKKGIKNKKTTFSILFNDYVKSLKSEGKIINVIKIEDLNQQLKNINISLSDLQLSCLCSKYSIPENVRLIKTEILEKDISEINESLNDNIKDNKSDISEDKKSEKKNTEIDKEDYDFDINEIENDNLKIKTNSFIEKNFDEINKKTI